MVTSLSLAFGLYALVQISDGNYVLGAWLIAFSMIFDSLDGKLARALNCSSEFGAEMDSLVDFVSFGVVPAFLAYKSFLIDFGNFGMLVALIYVLAGGYRLARYNSDLEDLTVKDAFSGLPIPSGAWVISSGVIFQYHYWDSIVFSQFFMLTVLLVSFMMTSKIEFPSNLRDYFPASVTKSVKYSFIISMVFMVKYAPIVYLFWCIFYISISLFRYIYLVFHNKENLEKIN